MITARPELSIAILDSAGELDGPNPAPFPAIIESISRGVLVHAIDALDLVLI